MEINSIEFITEAIKYGAFVGLTGGFLVWFTAWCLAKITHVFKTVSS